jgi:uncharacterized protein (DUF983 family)
MNSFDEYSEVVSPKIETVCPKCDSIHTLYDNTITMADTCLDCGHNAKYSKGYNENNKYFKTRWVGMFA